MREVAAGGLRPHSSAPGAIAILADPVLADAVERWIPQSARAGSAPGREEAGLRAVPTLRVEVRSGAWVDDAAAHGDDGAPQESGDPLLGLGGVDVHAEGDRRTFRGGISGVRGELDLGAGVARLWVHPGAPGSGADVYTLLTLAAALHLARHGRALVHAAAGVEPDGRAWLLAGDARAGKTTTLVNLATAGWGFLSDDQVVLERADDGGVRVVGWPRAFHLDEGWRAGRPTGRRSSLDPGLVEGGGWRSEAPLGGVILPRVDADRPTRLEPLTPGDALAGLVRQSPWLMSDPEAAPGALRLLASAASLPAARLRLGLDTFRDGPALARLVAAVARP